jgi:hypothetical protein
MASYSFVLDGILAMVEAWQEEWLMKFNEGMAMERIKRGTFQKLNI